MGAVSRRTPTTMHHIKAHVQCEAKHHLHRDSQIKEFFTVWQPAQSSNGMHGYNPDDSQGVQRSDSYHTGRQHIGRRQMGGRDVQMPSLPLRSLA